jgi:hypothetical protein
MTPEMRGLLEDMRDNPSAISPYAAVGAVDAALREIDRLQAIIDRPPLKLPRRIHNIFRYEVGEDYTADDVAKFSDEELKTMPCMGKLSFAHTKRWVAAYAKKEGPSDG